MAVERARDGFWYHRCSKCGYVWYSKKMIHFRCPASGCRSKFWNMDMDMPMPCQTHDWTNPIPDDLSHGVRQFKYCRACHIKEEIRFKTDTGGKTY